MALADHCSRRMLLGGVIAAAACSTSANASRSASIIQRTAARVIVDNDFAGDPDGLIALAHQLLSTKTRVTLITSSAVNPKLSTDLPVGRTALAGSQLVRQLISIMNLQESPSVFSGAETFGAVTSPAASAIISEAMRDDPLPLFLTCGGPLTNVAAALRDEPAIAKRLTLIWIGGGSYPAGEGEYNLVSDLAAAHYVLEQSSVPIWQVPQGAYREVQYSVAEMETDFRHISVLTKWLYKRYTMLPAWVDLSGSLTLGDSPLVLLTGLSAESSRSCIVPAREVLSDGRYGSEIPKRHIRVFKDIDQRLLIRDMLSRLKLHAVKRPG